MPELVRYRPDELLEVLERHQVLYVVIGGLAAELRGSPYVTRDVDVTPARPHPREFHQTCGRAERARRQASNSGHKRTTRYSP